MKTHPEVLKVLVALAKNLRASAKNMKAKKAFLQTQLDIHKKDPNAKEYVYSGERMVEQARSMHHALYNAFFIAKKAAGRKTY